MFNCIKLNEQEQILLSKIHLNPNDSHELQNASLEPMSDLAHLLIDRRAIPDIRLKYFTDSKLNIGRSSSRRDLFLRNVKDDDQIMRHPHFWKYLRYFIQGPDLPDTVIETFVENVKSCGNVTSGDIIPLCELARREVRNHRLERQNAADEFFKLALELDLEFEAPAIRNAVMKLGTAYDKMR